MLDSMMAGEVFTALNAEGTPFALFGVCRGAGWRAWGGSCVWMVGTDEVANHGRALLRHGRRFVQAWVAAYGLLGGFVHARHDAAVRTLIRLGFHVNRDGAVLLGPDAARFLPFHLAPGEA